MWGRRVGGDEGRGVGTGPRVGGADSENHTILTTMKEQGDAQGPSDAADSGNRTILTTILVSNGHSLVQVVVSDGDQLPPQTPHLSRAPCSHDQCRVCYGNMEEDDLISLGCQYRGGLAKAGRTCIDAWFHRRGSSI